MGIRHEKNGKCLDRRPDLKNRFAQTLSASNANAAENDIDNRVECADLMKLDFFDGCSVNL